MPVAVKRLKADCFQGHNEWLMEVDFLGKLEHPNIVKLIGFCMEGDNRLLVYEYMPKRSLENHLFRGGPQTLPWATRLDIAIGAAKRIAFLHNSESQVIYRDVKSSNIILHLDYSVRLLDFCLAKAGPTSEKTHVSTRVAGTQGYAAPEYIATGRHTTINDVYSFGVVLLELLSGRRAYMKSKSAQKHYLVDWANLFLTDRRNIFRIMDSKLEGKYPKRGAYGVATLALQCINSDARQRPRMSQVLEKLEQIRSLKKGLEVENETLLNGPIKSSKHHVTLCRSWKYSIRAAINHQLAIAEPHQEYMARFQFKIFCNLSSIFRLKAFVIVKVKCARYKHLVAFSCRSQEAMQPKF